MICSELACRFAHELVVDQLFATQPNNRCGHIIPNKSMVYRTHADWNPNWSRWTKLASIDANPMDEASEKMINHPG
jgi:hypothetical protein